MNPHVTMEMTVGTFLSLNEAQIRAIRENLLAKGQWENTPDEYVLRLSGQGDYVGAFLPGMFLGIEKDGYVHS